MNPTRAVEVLVDAGIIPVERRSSATAVLYAAEASERAFDFDELEARDTIPPCAPTLAPPAPTENGDG